MESECDHSQAAGKYDVFGEMGKTHEHVTLLTINVVRFTVA